MPSRDAIHAQVKAALQKEGWIITDDPYVISYGERFLFVDLGITGQFIGAERDKYRIAIEIKELRGKSPAVSTQVYNELFQEPIGQLVIRDLPLNLLVVDVETVEVKQWIPRL